MKTSELIHEHLDVISGSASQQENEMDYDQTINGFDIYTGHDKDGTPTFNAVKIGNPPPEVGYYSFNQVLKIKKIERRKEER